MPGWIAAGRLDLAEPAAVHETPFASRRRCSADARPRSPTPPTSSTRPGGPASIVAPIDHLDASGRVRRAEHPTHCIIRPQRRRACELPPAADRPLPPRPDTPDRHSPSHSRLAALAGGGAELRARAGDVVPAQRRRELHDDGRGSRQDSREPPHSGTDITRPRRPARTTRRRDRRRRRDARRDGDGRRPADPDRERRRLSGARHRPDPLPEDDRRTALLVHGLLRRPDTVATAAHCVHHGTSEGFFAPPAIGPTRPQRIEHPVHVPGGATVAARCLWTNGGYAAGGDERRDYAAIKTSCPIGNTVGWYGYINTQGVSQNLMLVNTQGYPGDKTFGTQWLSNNCAVHPTSFVPCAIAATEARQLFYANDTYPGRERGRPCTACPAPAVRSQSPFTPAVCTDSGLHMSLNHGTEDVIRVPEHGQGQLDAPCPPRRRPRSQVEDGGQRAGALVGGDASPRRVSRCTSARPHDRGRPRPAPTDHRARRRPALARRDSCISIEPSKEPS